MQKKNIFKALAFAMLMPAMLLTTACSSEVDVANTSNITNKGYALPVTVNATRGGDATRATYNESTKKLEFSTGDKLFVYGSTTGAGSFAGELTWQSGGTFSGTIYTQEEWTGTADDLFAAASVGGDLTATLLPNGYDANGSNSFLSIYNNNTTDKAWDDVAVVSPEYAFVASETAKATGVEQLSLEQASTYTYSNGFELAPQCAILNFTISGLEAGAKDVTLNVTPPIGDDYTVTGSVTPTSGVATFAVGVPVGAYINDMDNNLTVGSSNFTLPSSTTFAVGKIYNIARNAIPGALIGQFSVSADKKVYFSKGNLRYASGTWSFFDHQDDYYPSYSADAWDKFGWSTATTYGMNTSGNNSDYSGDFVDWGDNSDLQTALGTGWCTLSNDEWRYLFNNRSDDAADKYGFATVNGVYGIIILPDAFVDPNKNNGSDPFVGSTSTNDWDANIYTEENWALMEKNGAVFLPAAGYREGADVYDGDCWYWSSSAYGEDNAYYLYFRSDDLYDSYEETSTSRYCGHSVRLVRDVAAPAYTMAAAATTSDKGKLICTAGHIHVYGEDAACTKDRVAKIIYIGTTGHATYSHGLALALEDMSTSLMTWDGSGANNDGKTAAEWCSAWNTSKPVTDADWLLASKDQWNYMLGTNGADSYTALRDGFSGITGASNLQSYYYWSSTESSSSDAWYYDFNSGKWGGYGKNFGYVRVRACLAF